MYCTHCGNYVSEDDNFHNCPIKGHMKRVQNNSNDLFPFILSAGIAMATDSALLGGLLGGDIVGGVVGDLFNGDLFD
jgi:hypothetical protein